VGADVAAEREDCGEVYLEDLLQLHQLLFSFFPLKLGIGSPRSNHCPETPLRGSVVGYRHSSLGY